MRIDEQFLRQLSTDIYSCLDNNIHISYGSDVSNAHDIVKESISKVKALLEVLYKKEYDLWSIHREESRQVY